MNSPQVLNENELINNLNDYNVNNNKIIFLFGTTF